MNFNIWELKIIERLLSNRLSADFDPEVSGLLNKVRNQIAEALKEKTS